MTPFDRSCTTSYCSVILTIALTPCTIIELFDLEECRDLEESLKIIGSGKIQ